MSSLRRRRLDILSEAPHPAYVVWELTLRCDQSCRHCGSRAGSAREHELSKEEALDVARQLAEMGAREVVLIGGEAYLHEAFLDVARSLRDAGVAISLVTGGRAITEALAREMAAAGISMVSVSIDGLPATHDRIRSRGSFASATAALAHARAAGMLTGANTSLNRLNRGDLEDLYQHLRDAGISGWQVQITVPMGRAADRPDMMLQPWDLLDLVPRIAALKDRGLRERVLVSPGNNLGYFGPEEALMRSPYRGGSDHFCGCLAGRFILGIESDGSVKGCLSLQSRDYVGGNVRDEPLAAIWARPSIVTFTRERTTKDLDGFCATCPYGEICMAGCSFTAHSLFGRLGNNPYCHFRALCFAKQRKRERLVAGTPALGEPMDHGLFDIVIEDLDAPDPGATLSATDRVRIAREPVDPRNCR